MASGPTVTVPAGALSANTTITVAASTATAPAGAVSSLYQFGPAGTTFAAPVTVSFPVPAGTRSADVAVYWTKPGSTTEWDVLPATVSGTTARPRSPTSASASWARLAPSAPLARRRTPVMSAHHLQRDAGVRGHGGEVVADGAACGGVNVCTAGVCGARSAPRARPARRPGRRLLQDLRDRLRHERLETCGVSGNETDYTPCGSGNTCTAGTCTPLSCSPVANTFTQIQETRVAAAPPTPLGGTIIDGVYDLTARIIYTGPGGITGTQPSPYAGMNVISGGTLQAVIAYGQSPSQPVTPTVVTYSLVGTTYTVTSSVCGGGEVGYTLGYTATATELRTLAASGPSMGTLMVYTLRQAPACTSGQTCTPPTTPDLCKTYATACDTSGVQTCGVSGNAADGTSCGTGLTCQAGTCGSSGSTDYFPIGMASRYRATPPSPGVAFTEDVVPLTYTPPTWTIKSTASNRANYSVMTLVQSGGAVSMSGYVLHEVVGGTETVSTYTYDPPAPIVPADTTPGVTRTTQSTVTRTGASGTTTFTELRSWTVNGIESVSVPAGTFSALKITTVITGTTITGTTTPRTSVAWFVRGFGLVKSLNFENATPSSSTVSELSGYAPMNCSTGTCQPQACAAGTACTPAGTANPCKTYATTCDADGFLTCGVSGNQPDGTSCGNGLTCSTGACGFSGSPDLAGASVARSYVVTPSTGTPTIQTDEAVGYTLPSFTRRITSTNQATGVARYDQGPYQVSSLTSDGGGLGVVSSLLYSATGSLTSSFAYSPPALLLPPDIFPGATASRTSTVSPGVATQTRNLTVNGVESVTVPAGTFSALKVTTLIAFSNAPSSVFIAWYAPGVGRVKSLTYAVATPSATTTSELAAYSPMVCAGGACACNDLVNAATEVQPVYVPSSPPTSALGAASIVEGTYILTGSNIYSSPAGPSGPTSWTARSAYSLQSGTMQVVDWRSGVGEVRSTTAYQVSGSQLLLTPICGWNGVAFEPLRPYFGSTGNELRMLFYDLQSESPIVIHYPVVTLTRQ